MRENLATLQRFSDLAALLFFQRLFALAPVFLKRLSADSDLLCRQFNFAVKSALDGVTGGERHWARSLRVVAGQLAACRVRSAEQRWFELALIWVIERLENRPLTPEAQVAWTKTFQLLSPGEASLCGQGQAREGTLPPASG